MKTCPQCNREFKPSSRHRLCPICRAENSKIPCPSCSALMHRKSNLCSACTPSQELEANHNWRGGKYKKKNGYVMTRAKDHPRAPSNSGYVFEHILVMEEKIGRYLLPKENVHHINGIKDDNRPENLELWARNQPTGQRVSDLVNWAKEILAIYDSE